MTMNEDSKAQMTVFFVDVAGSVQLYDAIGDSLAHEKIVKCLKSISLLITAAGGRIVEIIGDEVMATFDHADQAFEAARQVQKQLGADIESQVGVRIGFHSGLTALTEGHPFGDTVNVAARMVNFAKSGQIIIDHQTVERLSKDKREGLRVVGRNYIKGKPEPYIIHEVLWDESENTMLLTMPRMGYANRRRNEASVNLKYRKQILSLNEFSGELVLGRGQQCGLVVDSGTASRTHAVVSCRNGMLIIKDQSTNGTFIRTCNGKRSTDGIEMIIHREQWMADAAGIVSLGAAIKENDPNLIHFRVI